MTDSPLRLMGAEGSPYSRKLRAVMRYRRIPHYWIHQGSPESAALPRPRVQLLPQLIVPDADGTPRAHTDSTPLVRELERRFSGRSVIPSDPALAFLDALLEDFADEWLTKAMFHYRWAFDADVANAAALLPRWFSPDAPEQRLVAAGKDFAERQVGRLWVVGSNEKTAALIEESYQRLLLRLDAHLSGSRFVFGTRPAVSDFALFGQLTQLVRVDPTPAAIAHETAMRVVAWVDLCDDLSGLEVESRAFASRDALPDSLRALFGEVGRVYPAFLLANAHAIESGAERVECTIDGRPWLQKPFPYQAKCLRWLREGYASLDAGDRGFVDEQLAGTGCEALFG